MRRWAVFISALVGTLSLAVGLGIGISHALAATPPAPALHSVPAGTLARAGVTLAAPQHPPYCRLEGTAPAQNWPGPDWTRCAISRQEAESARLPGFQGTVLEAVLARASGPPEGGLGSGRLVWLVVVRSTLLIQPTECGPPISSGMVCAWAHPAQTSSTLVVVIDAVSGGVVTTIPVLPGT
jgi:hypothetical protein